MNIEEKYDWNLVRLVDLCEVNPRLIHDKFTDDLEVSFLPMRYVDELSGIINFIEVKKLTEVKKGYTYFENGDIVFAKITPCMENGKIAIVDHLKNGIGFGSTEFHVLRCSEKISNKYLFYFLIQSSYRKIAQRYMTGTAGQLRVPKSFIENSEIPLPPLPEQKKIVAKIEELFSELDKGIEQLKNAKEQLRVYRQSVLSYAFSGRLLKDSNGPIAQHEMLNAAEPKMKYCLNQDSSDSMISTIEEDKLRKSSTPTNRRSEFLPEEWKWVKLGEIINSIQYGTSEKATANMDGIPIIRMGNIQEGKLDYSKLKYFPKNFSETNKYLLEDGDILFNRTNSAELVGKSAVYLKHHPSSIFASYLIRIKVNKQIYSAHFLNYLINSSYGRSYIKSVVSQNVGQANVNGTKLKAMPVPFPDLILQNKIVAELESRFSVADKLEQTIDENLKKAEALRQSILKKAFEGRLVQ